MIILRLTNPEGRQYHITPLSPPPAVKPSSHDPTTIPGWKPNVSAMILPG